jgi:hypothetical protein
LTNNTPTIGNEINYFRNLNNFFEEYAAKLMEMDLDKFHKETAIFNILA